MHHFLSIISWSFWDILWSSPSSARCLHSCFTTAVPTALLSHGKKNSQFWRTQLISAALLECHHCTEHGNYSIKAFRKGHRGPSAEGQQAELTANWFFTAAISFFSFFTPMLLLGGLNIKVEREIISGLCYLVQKADWKISIMNRMKLGGYSVHGS